MDSRDDECRNYMKMGKAHLYAGQTKAAERCFMRALEIAEDHQSPYASKRGIIAHRLATTAAKRGEVDLARRRFKTAERRITNDPLGLAICLRDHSDIERSVGNYRQARNLNARSETQLRRAALTRSTPRIKIESSTTQAFLAYVDIKEDRNVATAMQLLREVAAELHSYGCKPIYELTIVLWLVERLSPGEEWDSYVARAIELSAQLKNTSLNASLRLELQARTIAGLPGRDAYRLTSRLISFGANTLKGIARIIT